MRVFVCGEELGLAFVIAQRLLAEGHKVNLLTSWEELIPNLTKNGMSPVLGKIRDEASQRALDKADAVIDAQLPFTFPLERVHVGHLRPSLLRLALAGTGRRLIITSSTAVLGDTGSVPVGESRRVRPLRGFAWLPRMEKEILDSRGIVIRPAWVVHSQRPPEWAIGIGNWIKLARRFRKGRYIGTGGNCWSAVHFDDLADLYCLALKKARAGIILHAASENFSMKELVTTIHQGMGFKGEPSSLSLSEARRLTPLADVLTLSHALSGELAQRTLGWKPSRPSIMEKVADDAMVSSFVSKLGLPSH